MIAILFLYVHFMYTTSQMFGHTFSFLSLQHSLQIDTEDINYKSKMYVIKDGIFINI